jgi:hypothetical protein
MWTVSQRLSPEQPARKALEAKDRLGKGKGKTGVGDMVGWKGESQEGGKGDVCHPDVTAVQQ